MKNKKAILKLLFLLPLSVLGQTKPSLTLWYDEPAAQWEETLPLGNGRLGMMPDGGIEREHIVLNEISMWSGSEADYRNPKAAESLPAIRQLLLEGKNKEAQELMYTSFVPVKPEKGGTYGAFQMLADMFIDYTYTVPDDSVKNYKRWLDLEESVAYTAFTKGKVRFTREYFVSRNKDVIAILLDSDRPEALSFRITLSRPERGKVKKQNEGELEIAGMLDSGNPGQDGICYAAFAKVIPCGTQSQMQTHSNGTIEVRSADKAWIIVSAATSYLAGNIYRTEAQRLLNDATPPQLPDAYKRRSSQKLPQTFHKGGNNITGEQTLCRTPYRQTSGSLPAAG